MSIEKNSVELDKGVEVELLRLSDNGDTDQSFTVMMKWTNTITDVRNEIRRRNNVPSGRIDILYGGKRLPKNYSLYQLDVWSNYVKLLYFCRSPNSSSDQWIHIVSPGSLDKDFLYALEDVRNGFDSGIKPELSLYGSGGTYFLNDYTKWNLLVFKPEDEEPFAENNPRNLEGITGHSGFYKGIRSGEGWKREVAAYILDASHIFSVPTTVQAIIRHPFFLQHSHGLKHKVGSLQYFISDGEPCSDWSPSMYSVFEVQKIAFLDMYMLNADRNDANILVKRAGGRFTLFPIDHGYSLPDRFEINDLSWCWLQWKQVREPWSQQLKEYAKGLDIAQDVRRLNETLHIRQICLIVFRISGILLQTGIEYDLSPREIAKFYIREDRPSLLEKIVQQCLAHMHEYYNKDDLRGKGWSVELDLHEEQPMNRSSSHGDHVSQTGNQLLRAKSIEAFADVEYSQDPFRFPPDVEFKLLHDKTYRHHFFRVYKDAVTFYIRSMLIINSEDESGITL